LMQLLFRNLNITLLMATPLGDLGYKTDKNWKAG
jgi:hypothetical protein